MGSAGYKCYDLDQIDPVRSFGENSERVPATLLAHFRALNWWPRNRIVGASNATFPFSFPFSSLSFSSLSFSSPSLSLICTLINPMISPAHCRLRQGQDHPPSTPSSMSKVNIPDSPPPPNEELPSYEEATYQPPPQPARPQPQPPSLPRRQPPPPQRPQRPPPPRNPSASSSRPPDLYTANASLPWRYPSRHYCSKCQNLGYKQRNGKACLDCWHRFYLQDHAWNPNPNLPWRYPKRVMCEKCNNTGTKVKNGLLCQDCWERYGPRNPGMRSASFAPYIPSFSSYIPQPPMPPQPQMPLRVLPGDPRIGGVLCGRCRGTGLVTFFLDEDLCPQCQGCGRVFR